MTRNLYVLMQDSPEMYLNEIQDWLAIGYDIHISKTAIFENIHDTGMTHKLLCKAAAE